MDVTKHTEKAAVAAERGNYDYAIELYSRVLEVQPEHVEARKALRAVEVRRAQERGITKSGVSGWLRGLGHFLAGAIYTAIGKHEKAMAACESFLKNDPYNSTVMRLLARAAEKADHPAVAILVLEDVRASVAKTRLKGMALNTYIKVLRKLGHLYARTEQLPLASERLEEILKLKPGDREAEVDIKNIAAQRSMVEGGWDKVGKVGGYREVLKDEEAAKRLEDMHRDIRTREDVLAAIERCKADLAKDPNNTRYLTQLGDLYKMIKDWAQARVHYERAHQIDPHNFMVTEKIGDLRLAEMDDEIERAAADPAQQERAAQLRRERTRYAFEEYQKRVKARPQDLPTRFAYGNILFMTGQHYKEAAAQFQLASRDPRHRRTALFRLGICFQKQGLVDVAIEQFEKAIAGASVAEPEVKDILYALGEAHESQGRLGQALSAYKRIFEVDINFKDISAKIQELYSRGAKEAGPAA